MVVYTTRRAMGGNAKNGVKRCQARFNGFGQASQSVEAHDQDIAHVPVGQLGAHVGLKSRAFIGLDPDAQHVLDALHVHSDRQVSGPVLHRVIASDFDADRVQVDHRVERF